MKIPSSKINRKNILNLIFSITLNLSKRYIRNSTITNQNMYKNKNHHKKKHKMIDSIDDQYKLSFKLNNTMDLPIQLFTIFLEILFPNLCYLRISKFLYFRFSS